MFQIIMNLNTHKLEGITKILKISTHDNKYKLIGKISCNHNYTQQDASFLLLLLLPCKELDSLNECIRFH